MDYALITAIDDRGGLTLTRHRSTRHPACHLSDLDYADDIALFADTIQEVELLLHKLESASKSTGIFLNPSKTKYIHINPSANDSVHSSDGSKIEKVEDFKYIGSYINSQHDIQNSPGMGDSLRPCQSLESAHLQTHQTEDFQEDGRTDPDIWMRFMVANTNSKTCTVWHLHAASWCKNTQTCPGSIT